VWVVMHLQSNSNNVLINIIPLAWAFPIFNNDAIKVVEKRVVKFKLKP